MSKSWLHFLPDDSDLAPEAARRSDESQTSHRRPPSQWRHPECWRDAADVTVVTRAPVHEGRKLGQPVLERRGQVLLAPGVRSTQRSCPFRCCWTQQRKEISTTTASTTTTTTTAAAAATTTTTDIGAKRWTPIWNKLQKIKRNYLQNVLNMKLNSNNDK